MYSDHKSLKWLFSLNEPKHRVTRWNEALFKLNFEVEYQPHKKHVNADALSWYPNPRDCSCPPAEKSRLSCKACRKYLRLNELMWGEIPGIPTTVQGNPMWEVVGHQGMLTPRTEKPMPIGTIPSHRGK